MTDISYTRPYREPYETCIMAFLLLGSLATFLPGGGSPRSVQLTLNHPVLLAWSLMLPLGSLITLIGIFWRGRYITALGVERVGLIFNTGALLTYTVALVASNQRGNAVVSIAFITAIAVANIWRVVSITGSIRRILALAKRLNEEGVA